MSATFGIFTARNHEEFARQYLPVGHREFKMSRADHEEIILGRKGWHVPDPEFEMHLAATFLAAVGELGGPSSRLGANRHQALRLLRQYLTRAHILEIEEIVEDYDASGPHPRHVFGSGRPGAEGPRTETQQHTQRRKGLWTRLVDALPSRRRTVYALSIPRRWRRLRYSF